MAQWENMEDKGLSPYYKDEDVFIINADCRDIHKRLDKVDLVLTDPPYGMNYYSNHYKGLNPHKPIANDDTYPSDLIPIWKDLSNKAVLSFCRWDNLSTVPKPKSFIAWIKNNWTAGDLLHEYGRQWEGILFYPMTNHSWVNRPSDVMVCDKERPYYHPTEKPVDLMSRLISQNTMKGDVVLDPFLGSGTTAVAAKLLGRKCIGIEIDESYCKIAAIRCSQSVMEFSD
jgi:site-specific DNA-methyltransferase (adenine-specific)